MKRRHYDLVIVGGGASGMAAAIRAKQISKKISVAVLEKNAIFGKKLRATGNGRGNLSNTNIPTYQETLAFFHSIGLLTRIDETGRVYPFSESASACAELMSRCAKDMGCDLFSETTAEKIAHSENGFLITTSGDIYIGKKIILATGGKAGISSAEKQKMHGMDGYAISESLGHAVRKTTPVLTGVKIDEMPKSLAGIRVKGAVSLMIDGQTEPLFDEEGEIQFTDYGLSGICIFNLSRFLKYIGDQKLSPYRITIDLDPEGQGEALFLGDHNQEIMLQQSIIQVLRGMLKKPLAELVVTFSEIDGMTEFGKLRQNERHRLYQTIRSLTFRPSGTMGFQMAQCTAGGVYMDELEPENGASKIVPGLYITGELMDFDGPCGGYNLDHAFRTGALAAKHAVKALLSEVAR